MIYADIKIENQTKKVFLMIRKILTLSLFTLLFCTLNASDIKLKMLFVQSEQCQWCKKMNKEIFENEDRVDDLEDMYEIKKVLRGSKEIPKFIKPKYYPTTYILSSDSKKLIDELPGYIKPEHFMDYVSELYNIEITDKN